MTTDQPAISARKADHIDLCTDGDVAFQHKTNLFEQIQLVHDALPDGLRRDLETLDACHDMGSFRTEAWRRAGNPGIDQAMVDGCYDYFQRIDDFGTPRMADKATDPIAGEAHLQESALRRALHLRHNEVGNGAIENNAKPVLIHLPPHNR